MPRTLTRYEQARRIFYSQADPEQIVRGYARIHNDVRRELKRARVNGKGRRLLERTAFASYMEGWSK
jgi:hypothetical protein